MSWQRYLLSGSCLCCSSQIKIHWRFVNCYFVLLHFYWQIYERMTNYMSCNDKDGNFSLWTYVSWPFLWDQGYAGEILSKRTLTEYLLLMGTDHGVVCHPPITWERPQPIRVLPAIECGTFHHLLIWMSINWGAQVPRGSVLRYLLYWTLWAVAVGGTPTVQTLKFTG